MKTCEQCHLRYPNESSFCFVDGKPLVFLQDPRVGSTISGRYVIQEVIGEGGMATVYRAQHKLIERPVAVKIINPGLSRDQIVRERFRREARAAQKLAHPNIIEIFEHGETEDGTSYLVMELLEGRSLAEALAKGAMTCERAVPIMVQMARALARAHDFEVIHRDLKPENIFISQRTDGPELVKLLDFGIARSMQDARITGAGEVFGTPQYMAPERITSIDAGAPSDLYAMGVIYFKMVTNELPFGAIHDIPTYFLKHLREPPPKLRSVLPSAPASLESLLLSMMAKEPGDRPVDAHRVKSDLIAICAEMGVKAPAEPEAEQPSSRMQAELLPPVALDQWSKRATIFEQMLAHAYPGSRPSELTLMLEDIHRLMREASGVREESVTEQRKLQSIEARGLDGRQRFGSAVDALGVDASRARDEARLAHSAAAPLITATIEARADVLKVHEEVLFWEGRSAFQEPYDGLRDAYGHAELAVDRWLSARKREKEVGAKADARDRELADLEFQIQELRNALARLEQSVEAEQALSQRRVSELDGKTEALQVELLAMATRFCSPLRRRPELSGLFRELEANAQAA